MATYEFVCGECSEEFEFFVRGFLKAEDKRCPTCGSTIVRQKFSSFLSNLGASGCSTPRRSGFG
jgi:putative FmdB family regulatory protein